MSRLNNPKRSADVGQIWRIPYGNQPHLTEITQTGCMAVTSPCKGIARVMPHDSLNERCEHIIKLHILLARRANTACDAVKRSLQSPALRLPSIRRDLTERLEPKPARLIRRTHGGATLRSSLWNSKNDAVPPYDQPIPGDGQQIGLRWSRNDRIGLAAAEMVRSNETIGLSAGTTTTHIGRSLRHREKIQVITNAVNIAMEALSNQTQSLGYENLQPGSVTPVVVRRKRTSRRVTPR